MKYLAPFVLTVSLVLACFTAPNGDGVWIVKEQVVSIGHPDGCIQGAKSRVTLGNGTFFCLSDTIKEALQKLEAK